MKIFSKVKKIWLWIITVFFALGAILYIPNAATMLGGFVALIAALLLLPISAWQALIYKYIPKTIKTILAVVFSILFFVVTPVEKDPATRELPSDMHTTVSSSIDTENEESEVVPISTPTVKPTATPTTKPTVMPSAKPTSKPTVNPTSTPVPVSTSTSINEKAESDTEPTAAPTTAPTAEPTTVPTPISTQVPTSAPTVAPTPAPTPEPIQESPSIDSKPEPQPEENSQMVWIPNSGTKYHSHSSCSNMENPTQVTVSEAQSLGFTPCKKCY